MTLKNNNKVKHFCIICAFVVQMCVFPFNAIAVTPQLKDPVFLSLSTRDGLSQDSINEMVVDDDGFLWLATEAGLDRWDGYLINHVTGPNDEFDGVAISSIFQDSSGVMWVSTTTSGVYRFDLAANTVKNVVRRPFVDQPEYNQYASNFFEEPSGDILISNFQSLLRYHKDSGLVEVLFELDEQSALNGQMVRWVITHNNVLYLATSSSLYAADLRKESFDLVEIDYLSDFEKTIDTINSKHLRVDGNLLWVSTVNGLFLVELSEIRKRLDGQDGPVKGVKQGIANRNVWRTLKGSDGITYAATDIGIFQVSLGASGDWEAQYLFEPQIGQEELARKTVQAMVQDSNNNLWLGTYISGALYWSQLGRYFTTIQNSRWQQQDKPLANNTVWTLYEDRDETLWVGTDNGLSAVNLRTNIGEHFLVTPPEDLLPYSTSNIVRIVPGGDSTLYLETFDGLLVFDKKTKKASRFPFDTDESYFEYAHGLATDKSGRVYFADENIYRYDPTTEQLEILDIDEKYFIPREVAQFFRVDSQLGNRMIVSTYGALWALDVDTLEAEKIHELEPTLKTADTSPSSYVLDNNNTIWIAYPNVGIMGVNVDTYREEFRYGKETLGASTMVYGLQLDGGGNLWYSSHAGIHRYSLSNRSFTHYGYGNPLTVAEFNQGAAETFRDGRIAFGSPKGVVVFDPVMVINTSRQSIKTQANLMALSQITLDSRPLSLPMKNLTGEHIKLQHDDYGLMIHFSPLQYNLFDASFRYKLTSNNKVLSEAVTKDSKVLLPALSPGKYRFEVMPASQLLDRTFLPANLTISVAYAPWRSPVAYISYGLMIVILLGWYLFNRQLQINRLKRAQAQVKLFGNAFKQTSDWVVIFDSKYNAVAANPAFERAFGLSHHERIDRQMEKLYQSLPRLKRQLPERLTQLAAGEFWKDEDVIQLNDGRQYDVLIDITVMEAGLKEAQDAHFLVVISDITDQKNAERKLLKLANYDNLTGLVNRSLLLDRLEHAIANAQIHKTPVAVLFVDLDRFKGINDSLGHDYGDKLLRVVANRMLNLASSNDTVARLGGDEFVIVMEEVRSTDMVSSFVGKLIESVETPISLSNEVLRISCSVGVSFYPNDATDPAELLKQADVAMYSAKKDTLNAFIYFTEEMNARARERLHFENLIKSAYQSESFINYYQPIVNIESGKTEGVELLLRCQYDGMWVSPQEFVPILEELRYIIDVTRKALERAITDLTRWYDAGFTGYISVNLSALHFKTHFDLDWLRALLAEAGIPHRAIRFEITEGVLMDNSDDTLAQINRMKADGFSLALDDFGTGYSSLSYLKRFPLQVLKIDKSFIDDIGQGSVDNALVDTTITLAHSLHMGCVAEGVETVEQALYLLEHGCPTLQGYLFSKPVDASDVMPLLTKYWRLGISDFVPII